MDLGTALREARERRGLSVEGLARVTKIKLDQLRAIEANQFDKLPSGIFRRGFLRSYAREVGLDPQAVVQRYIEDYEPRLTTAPAAPPTAQTVRRLEPAPPPEPDTPTPSGVISIQWIAVALVAAAVVGYTVLEPRLPARDTTVRSAPTQLANTGSGAADRGAAPAAPTTGSAPGQQTGTSGSSLRIEIVPKAPCWVAATSDGERVLYALLQPGERRSIEVHDGGVVLRVGDPTAFAYTINGVAGRPLGDRAHPVTVTIERSNYRQYLSGNSTPTRTGG